MDFSSLPANELLQFCSQNGSDEAWREFVRRFQRPIALAVLRTARFWGVQSVALIDDLVQDTLLRLCSDNCRLLKSFVPREEDSAVGYVKMVAVNITHDKLRSEKTLKRGGAYNKQGLEQAEFDGSLASPDSTTAVERSIQRSEVDRALRSLIPDPVSERDRTIFWLYFEQGFSAREISQIQPLALTVKGVESSIHRTTQQVRDLLQQVPVIASQKGNPNALPFLKEKR